VAVAGQRRRAHEEQGLPGDPVAQALVDYGISPTHAATVAGAWARQRSLCDDRPVRRAVVVVGSVNVDLVVAAPRLPRPGETVVGERLERHGGGKGANAAVAAARLGADVELVAAVGDDELGREALTELDAEGVGLGAVARLDGVPTGAALIVVDAAGENQIAVGAGANGALDGGRVEAALAPLLAEAAIVLISCEIPLDGIAAAAARARAAGLPVVLNPAPALPGLLDAAAAGALLTPNASEAAALSAEQDPEAAAGALSARTGAPVLVTLGADGVLLQTGAGEPPRRLPAAPVDRVVDTTGAGDTFNGALAAALAAGRGLVDAAAFAVAAAGHTVRDAGARAAMPRGDSLAP